MSNLTAKLRLALQWRDAVADGEMIQAPHYTKEYMGFKEGVFQAELDAICDAANMFYSEMGSPLRIWNSMGELRPMEVRDVKP